MTNTQHAELMRELRAIRAVLERSAELAERLAPPPEPIDLGKAAADMAHDAHVLQAGGASALDARLAASPGAQRKRDERGKRGGK